MEKNKMHIKYTCSIHYWNMIYTYAEHCSQNYLLDTVVILLLTITMFFMGNQFKFAFTTIIKVSLQSRAINQIFIQIFTGHIPHTRNSTHIRTGTNTQLFYSLAIVCFFFALLSCRSYEWNFGNFPFRDDNEITGTEKMKLSNLN